ncbi:MAG: hypothetical protein WD096_02630, partial [Actinomycetota bacterium]
MKRSQLIGWASGGFFGGRAEARIVRTPVPVVYLDVNSTYPLVNALLGTWGYLRADKLRNAQVTRRVRQLLAAPDLLDRCLEPATWHEIGVTLVELEPGGDTLPVRAPYDPAGADPGIGVNPLHYEGTLWYMLPDVIAATLLGNSPPRVVRAIRVVPEGVQTGLRSVRLRGERRIDPAREDPFIAMVEERRRLQGSPDGDTEASRWQQRFLKVTANSTAYGSLARFDRVSLGHEADIMVFGPDQPFTWRAEVAEDPGPYCEPPVAASITAGARLLLAMLERLVTDAGGVFAATDTDSMMIVAIPSGGEVSCETAEGSTVRALSFETVRAIAGRFRSLLPFDPALVTDVWKAEHDSLDEPLWAYVISAKRYCLFRYDDAGDPVLVDRSEHGLGLYLDPTDPERPRLDENGERVWISEAWAFLLRGALGIDTPEPAWLDTLALTRFTISSPTLWRWFAGYDAAHPEAPIRPGSFGLLAHTDHGPLAPTDRRIPLPAAPYESDPRTWKGLGWFDAGTGKQLRITTASPRGDPARFAEDLAAGCTPVRTLRSVLEAFVARPEHKSLAPDGAP